MRTNGYTALQGEVEDLAYIKFSPSRRMKGWFQVHAFDGGNKHLGIGGLIHGDTIINGTDRVGSTGVNYKVYGMWVDYDSKIDAGNIQSPLTLINTTVEGVRLLNVRMHGCRLKNMDGRSIITNSDLHVVVAEHSYLNLDKFTIERMGVFNSTLQSYRERVLQETVLKSFDLVSSNIVIDCGSYYEKTLIRDTVGRIFGKASVAFVCSSIPSQSHGHMTVVHQLSRKPLQVVFDEYRGSLEEILEVVVRRLGKTAKAHMYYYFLKQVSAAYGMFCKRDREVLQEFAKQVRVKGI